MSSIIFLYNTVSLTIMSISNTYEISAGRLEFM